MTTSAEANFYDGFKIGSEFGIQTEDEKDDMQVYVQKLVRYVTEEIEAGIKKRIEDGIVKAISGGFAEGFVKAKKDVAEKMAKNGMPNTDIQKMTDLPIELIEVIMYELKDSQTDDTV